MRESSQDIYVSVLVIMIFVMSVILAAHGDIVETHAVIVSIRPRDGEVYIDDKVTLSCRRTHEIQLAVAYWKKDGVALSLNARVHFYTNYSKSIVVIEAVRKDDNGLYVCGTEESSNGTQLSSYEKRLHVKDRPFVFWQVGNVAAAIQHKNITIRCDNVSTATVAVFKDGFLVHGKRARITHNATGLDLTILNVRSSDAGQYTCWGSDGVESSNSSTRLTVYWPPTVTNITIIPTNVKNRKWALLCETEGKPKPTVKWKSKKLLIIFQYENPLLLDINHDKDNYTVTCIAENAAGRDSRTVLFTLRNKTPNESVNGSTTSSNVSTAEPTQPSSGSKNENDTWLAASIYIPVIFIVLPVVVVVLCIWRWRKKTTSRCQSTAQDIQKRKRKRENTVCKKTTNFYETKIRPNLMELTACLRVESIQQNLLQEKLIDAADDQVLRDEIKTQRKRAKYFLNELLIQWDEESCQRFCDIILESSQNCPAHKKVARLLDLPSEDPQNGGVDRSSTSQMVQDVSSDETSL